MHEYHRWKRRQMWKVIVVFILYLFLSALLRLESKLIVAACRDASVIRGIFRVRNVRTRKIPLITFVITVPALDIWSQCSLQRQEDTYSERKCERGPWHNGSTSQTSYSLDILLGGINELRDEQSLQKLKNGWFHSLLAINLSFF
jgi:hypothetical protein